MAKVQKSYRLSQQQIDNLDELVELYKDIMKDKIGAEVKVTPATVLGILIDVEHKDLTKQKEKTLI